MALAEHSTYFTKLCSMWTAFKIIMLFSIHRTTQNWEETMILFWCKCHQHGMLGRTWKGYRCSQERLPNSSQLLQGLFWRHHGPHVSHNVLITPEFYLKASQKLEDLVWLIRGHLQRLVIFVLSGLLEGKCHVFRTGVAEKTWGHVSGSYILKMRFLVESQYLRYFE